MTRYRKQIRPEDSKFRKLRIGAKLSQEELAYSIGVAVSTIRRWEKGQAEPTMTKEQMEKFCSAVNQSFTALPTKLATS